MDSTPLIPAEAIVAECFVVTPDVINVRIERKLSQHLAQPLNLGHQAR